MSVGANGAREAARRFRKEPTLADTIRDAVRDALRPPEPEPEPEAPRPKRRLAEIGAAGLAVARERFGEQTEETRQARSAEVIAEVTLGANQEPRH
jgi:hypothetical protein